jgi:hypothetical protein
MKNMFLFFIVLFALSCTKKKGIRMDNTFPIPKTTQLTTGCNVPSVVSYSLIISPLLMNNCQGCHLSPSAFSCDSYASTKASALSGNLMTYITNTDPSNTMMPPPPLRHLDSCEIKALNLWITQGCLNN